MTNKRKVNATPDSIVLGLSGEALLVMGLIIKLLSMGNLRFLVFYFVPKKLFVHQSIP